MKFMQYPEGGYLLSISSPIMVQKMPYIKPFSCHNQKTKLCILMSCQAAVVLRLICFL